MKFWFDKGVSGLRLDAVESYTEDPLLRDEPLLNPSIEKDEYGWLEFDHVYTRDFPENFEFIHELRLFTNQINKIKGDDERCEYCEVRYWKVPSAKQKSWLKTNSYQFKSAV